MRGAHKDLPVTKLLFANGLLTDRRSFVGWREQIPHLYLKGADMSNQRNLCCARDKGHCRKCKRECGVAGEVHHVLPRGKGGSDDLTNLEWRCGRFVGDCHTSAHVAPRFGESRPKAVEEFNRINPVETT